MNTIPSTQNFSTGVLSHTGGTRPTPAGVESPKQKELWGACQALESVFASYLLEGIKKSLPGTSANSGMAGADIYAGMMTQALSDEMSSSNTLGFSQMLYRSLSPRGVDSGATALNSTPIQKP